MLRRRIRKFRQEEGQALVEFAFVIPMILLVLFGIVDFALALNQKNADTNIANIAVREGAVIGTTTSATCNSTTYTTLGTWAACESSVSGGPAVTVCVGDTASSSAPTSNTYTTGDPMEVEVTSNFNWVKLISKDFSSLTSSIGSSATMRVEGALTGTNPFLSPVCTS